MAAAVSFFSLAIPAAQAEGSGVSERERVAAGMPSSTSVTAGARQSRSETRRCLSARMGLAFYRMNYSRHRTTRGLETPYPAGRKPRNCADARYLANVWRKRAFQQRRATEHYLSRTLRDFAFCDGCRAWTRAVGEVQRVFPGTAGWLLSCSAAEGGHGRWVGYGGQPYSTWLRDSDTVGGPLQFRWSTFRGMYRRALEHVRERGFRVPPHLRELGDGAVWRSALGQALAGGWARYTGNDDSHWSASWGNGC